jgi:nitrite reductase/ring-hydroxylating ferredoxin subunit
LAEIPQNLQWSFMRYQVQRLKHRLTGSGRMTGQDSAGVQGTEAIDPVPNLVDLRVGEITAISKTQCAARLENGEIVSFPRRCPHAGGDLASGWIEDGQVNCPLHLMTFDLQTGRSPCRSLGLRSQPLGVAASVRVPAMRGTNDQ